MSEAVDGYNVQFWRENYRMLRDAIVEHLEPFIHEDDVAEEAILIDAVEAAGAAVGLPAKDSQRLDWLENRVHGTGEMLTMGGSCSWGVEVQRGRYGRSRPLGEGEDLRDAIDDAMSAAAAPTPESRT